MPLAQILRTSSSRHINDRDTHSKTLILSFFHRLPAAQATWRRVLMLEHVRSPRTALGAAGVVELIPAFREAPKGSVPARRRRSSQLPMAAASGVSVSFSRPAASAASTRTEREGDYRGISRNSSGVPQRTCSSGRWQRFRRGHRGSPPHGEAGRPDRVQGGAEERRTRGVVDRRLTALRRKDGQYPCPSLQNHNNSKLLWS